MIFHHTVRGERKPALIKSACKFSDQTIMRGSIGSAVRGSAFVSEMMSSYRAEPRDHPGAAFIGATGVLFSGPSLRNVNNLATGVQGIGVQDTFLFVVIVDQANHPRGRSLESLPGTRCSANAGLIPSSDHCGSVPTCECWFFPSPLLQSGSPGAPQ